MTLVGQNPEPFLEAALRSVDWVDGYAVVNTDPEGRGATNEAIIRRVVDRERLRVDRLWMSSRGFDFAKARNAALAMIPEDAYVLIVDADEVYYSEFEAEARRLIAHGHDSITSHYFHLAVRKDLLHSERDREILFRNGPGVRFESGVHERLVHPRAKPVVARGYHGAHYGYIKTPREVAARWEFYRSLGSEVHDYDASQPDRALDDWPRVCRPFWREHPPAVREVLESYPSTPPRHREGPTATLLVLLTWDDAENLRKCLASLWTTDTPFWLVAVDNGSTDETLNVLREYQDRVQGGDVTGDGPCRQFWIKQRPGLSLAQALNVGFSDMDHLTGDYTPPYIGWIHPDMTFDWPDWLGRLRDAMDEHPEWVKLGAQEAHDGNRELRPGNSQCYIVRRTALEKVGLFDERFLACGGYEDWEMNSRLLTVGEVMILPEAMIRHEAMSTRARHDNTDAARRNADLYHEIVGQWEAVV
jgi:GT2 family glycosyltransferase